MGKRDSHTSFEWACPVCRRPLAAPDWCPTCSRRFECLEGIWHFLTDSAPFRTFLNQYEIVRRAEGWGHTDAFYYRTLPEVDKCDPNRAIWVVRNKTFGCFLRRILTPLEWKNPLRVIDLGAGNGWLAHRLALRGHRVAAVDLRIDSFDGLGAHVHYDSAFLPVRANYERLPFAGDQFDLAIFSASLHYAVKSETALCEALRVLRPGGALVVMDSPLYADDAAGRAMIRRRETSYSKEHGFAAETLEAEGFLTRERLRELARAAEINWTRFHPYLGAERVIRSAVARVTGRHRPADFPVLITKKEFTRVLRVVELEHTL